MAELTISADEIRSAIESYVSSYSPEASREEVGVVSETGDGIARVEGLPSAMTKELLEFEGGTLGIALNLDVRDIGVVNYAGGAPTLALTGRAKDRLDAMIPEGHAAQVHLTMTDDHPFAQAFVVISALPIDHISKGATG